MTKPTLRFPSPQLQIDFAFALRKFRVLYLQEALLTTVGSLDIATLDAELAEYVPAIDLISLARCGLRGELLFATPSILNANPYLLGYYRLLLGYSQKEFFGGSKGFGASGYKSMETGGKIGRSADISALCSALCAAASQLLSGLSTTRVSRELLDDLTLLTVGPQLRGGANNQRGVAGIVEVFEIIREIVDHATVDVSDLEIKVKSATRRAVSIEFAPDPDIIVREEMARNEYRNVVAIEIKSGTDISNIHNRIGEAEKSHQKARQRGFTECWTVVNVARLDMDKAKSESPSTDRFYSLARLAERKGNEYDDFRRRILSLTSIPEPPVRKARSRMSAAPKRDTTGRT